MIAIIVSLGYMQFSNNDELSVIKLYKVGLEVNEKVWDYL